MQRPAADAVIGERAVSVPAFEIERTVGFMALTLECAKKTVELIAKQQNAEWIFVQDLAQLFDGRIVDDVALTHRRDALAADCFLRAL